MIQGAAFRVLAGFYDSDSRNFADLCERAGYPTDLGGYYIRQLVKGKYLEKTERGHYHILPKGKQELAFSYGKRLLELKPRLSVLIVVRQASAYLAIRRKVQPFIGVVEWPAGIVFAGETMDTAAKRVLQARFEVMTTPEFHGFFRRTDMYGDMVFDDKLFAIFTCNIPETAQPAAENSLGDTIVLSPETLQTLSNPSRALLDVLAFTKSPVSLQERTYELTAGDLGFSPEQ